MLKPEMIEKLNEQMNLELYSSLLYQHLVQLSYLRRCCRVPAPSRPGRDDAYAASV